MIGHAVNAVKTLGVITLAFSTGQLHQQVPPTSPIELGEQFVPRPEVAKLAAVGFDAALSDYFWLRVVQLVGATRGDPAQHAAVLGQMIDVVTTLDPWVDHPYRFAGIWLTDSPESVRKANELLRRGIEHHPDEWRNHFYLGFNHYFYLGEDAEAADALERATRLPGSPRYLPRLVARLRSQADDLETAEVFLLELARGAEDDGLRSTCLAALDEIGVERRARELDAAREAYRERFGRDIASVEDLLEGSAAVLDRLPDPEPAGLPSSLRRGARWELDAKTGRIVSSYFGRRYETTLHPSDAKRRAEWSTREQEDGV